MIMAHGDVDGVISAVIAARSLGVEDPEIRFSGPRSVDSALSRVEGDGGRLVLVDIAINPDRAEAVGEQLERLRDAGWDILWIDHHAWPEEVVERISSLADLRLRPAPSAARVVLEELGGGDYEEELARIADDADTATYSDERARMFNSLTRDREKREYLVRALLAGRVDDERIRKWAEERLRKQERMVERGLRRSRLEETSGGRRFAIVDLRPRGGPGSLISKRLADERGVDFSLVIYSCERFSLYAGRDKSVNLKPLCEAHRGGGHPYACGGRLRLNPLERILCLLSLGRYTPGPLRRLVDEIKRSL